MGLEFELVAQANPYTDDISGGLIVQLWRNDLPLGDTQIEVFAKDASGDVTITQHRTDTGGFATIPMAADTEYLIDAVILSARDPSEGNQNAVWHSDWAALTFQTGADLGD